MNKPFVLTALGLTLVSLVLVGAGAWVDTESIPIGKILLDGLLVAAMLVFFLMVLHRRMSTPIQIFVAMLLGVLAGWAFSAIGKGDLVTEYFMIFGQLFILLLKMVIVPLVFVSVLLGAASLGDVQRLGSLGGKTIAYYLCSTGVAVIIGLTFVNIVQPGNGLEGLIDTIAEQAPSADEAVPAGLAIQQSVLPAFIQNPIMPGAPILAIITFALLLGAALTVSPDKSDPAIQVFKGIDGAIVTLVLWIMTLAPLGVFALMANAIATLGIEYIQNLAVYCVTVLFSLAAHLAFLTLILIPFVARMKPMRFLRGMAPAMQLAFSTSSSSATLPVSIECASHRVGINRGITGFMLPIGATINMDGTALYTSVASIFVAEVYGMSLGIQEQLLIFVTAIVVSIGTAGIPGASIGMMTIIFSAVGIPVEGIGLVIGVDRVLDMCRTMVNVTGDSVGAAVIARLENAPEEEIKLNPPIPTSA